MLRSLTLTTLLASVVLALTPVHGVQAQQQDENQQRATQLLRDFIHFVRIARFDAADLTGQNLLSLGLEATAFVDVVERADEADRFTNAVALAQRAEGQADLERTAAALAELFNTGKLERSRDGAEIARNIELLGGNMRGRVLAEERLVSAGEYAVPRLLEAFLRTDNAAVRVAAGQVLIRLGQQAVMPLSVSLQHLAPEQQELVLGVLGQIPYRQSVPFVAALRASTGSERVRAAADRTLAALDAGTARQRGDAAWLFASLGEAFYAERLDVTSFPGEAFQLVWRFAPDAPELSLQGEAVRTEVFHEIMAMRLAAESLRLAPESPEALALWIASNLRREIQNPDGYSDPFFGNSDRDAEYFAVASGNEIAQRVLGRAIDDRDTRLALRSIDAVSRVAGGRTLWDGLEGRRPLVEAMLYPNRRVQYESALAIGGALPTSDFPGSERVIPLLAGAVRDADERFAQVLAEDQEAYQAVRSILQGEGYQVLPRAASIEAARDEMADVAGIDLIVVVTTGAQVEPTVDQIRGTTGFAATPVLALVSRADAVGLSARYERDPLTSVRPRAIPANELRNAMTRLVERASGGPIGSDEAKVYAERALETLRDLAITGGGSLDPRGAVAPLISALTQGSAADPMLIASVLAEMEEPTAQRALMEQALAAQGANRVALLELTSHNVKRFGGHLETRHIDRLMELVANAPSEEGTAAAALAGALGLPNDRLLPLILGGS